MAFNNTARERRIRLKKDLAKKIRLEKSLVRQMNIYFNKIARESSEHYHDTRKVLDTSQFNQELEDILLAHYEKVQNAFSKTFQEDIAISAKSLKLPIYLKKQDFTSSLNASLQVFRDQRSEEQTGNINDTNQDELEEAYNFSINTLIENKVELVAVTIALLAAQKFIQRSRSRADLIGVTETQATAESTKGIEATALGSASMQVGDVIIDETNIEKIWTSVLDNRTRLAHAVADGQRRPEEDPFLVDGEMLMYPADTSLGASLGNIINCRCNSTRAVNLDPELGGTRPRGRPPIRGATLRPDEISPINSF